MRLRTTDRALLAPQSATLGRLDWWPEVNPAFSGGPDLPPPTKMEAMHVDEDGRLWLYINRPTQDWRDHVEIGLPVEGAFRYGPGATEWLMEVVDMEAGRVIVSQVVDVEPGAARFFVPGWLGRLQPGRIPAVPDAAGAVAGIEQS